MYTRLFHPFTCLLILYMSASAVAIDVSDWTNPLLGYADKSIKDYTVAEHEGKLYIFHSTFLGLEPGIVGQFRTTGYDSDSSGARTAASKDIVSHVQGEVYDPETGKLSQLPIDYSGREDGWKGMASPSITPYRGRHIMVYNSWGNLPDKPNALFYRLSDDLENWSDRKPLAHDLIKDWAIDGNLIDTGERVILFWKTRGQTSVTRAAMAPSAEGPFRKIPGVDGHRDGEVTFSLRPGVTGPTWFENTNIYRINGEWRLLAVHMKIPYLFRLKGTGEYPQDWLRWEDGYPMVIHRQPWNAFVASNGPEILPSENPDKPHLVFYGGKNGCFRSEFIGRGWYKLGVSQSFDLENWEPLPPAPILALRLDAMDQYRGGKHERFDLRGPFSYRIELQSILDCESEGKVLELELYSNRTPVEILSFADGKASFMLEPGIHSILGRATLASGKVVWTHQPLVLRLDW